MTRGCRKHYEIIHAYRHNTSWEGCPALATYYEYWTQSAPPLPHQQPQLVLVARTKKKKKFPDAGCVSTRIRNFCFLIPHALHASHYPRHCSTAPSTMIRGSKSDPEYVDSHVSLRGKRGPWSASGWASRGETHLIIIAIRGGQRLICHNFCSPGCQPPCNSNPQGPSAPPESMYFTWHLESMIRSAPSPAKIKIKIIQTSKSAARGILVLPVRAVVDKCEARHGTDCLLRCADSDWDVVHCLGMST